jgi:hypothetical protein
LGCECLWIGALIGSSTHTPEFYREVDAFRFGVEFVTQFANFTETAGREC